jgi:anaerobic ribonucleoside-triphosphate reductase activating protein
MGGEPLSRCSDNRRQIIQLCKEVKRKFPNKTIWCWSGFLFEEILKDPYMRPILDYIDVLVDGPFIQEKKDLSTPFRGSTNQRIIDVKKTMKSNHVVLYEV